MQKMEYGSRSCQFHGHTRLRRRNTTRSSRRLALTTRCTAQPRIKSGPVAPAAQFLSAFSGTVILRRVASLRRHRSAQCRCSDKAGRVCFRDRLQNYCIQSEKAVSFRPSRANGVPSKRRIRACWGCKRGAVEEPFVLEPQTKGGSTTALLHPSNGKSSHRWGPRLRTSARHDTLFGAHH